jgi:hypothetical protein
LLLYLIKNTKDSRIVNVSNTGHKTGNINFDDLNWEKRKYNDWKAYGDSKIAKFMEMRGYPKKVETNELSKNEEIANRLWDVSEKLTGVTYP